MKTTVLAFVLLFATSAAMAQVTVTFNNLTTVYYGVTFQTSAISGSCPSTPVNNIYIDVPNNHGRQATAIDEAGNTISSVSSITGITFWSLPIGPGTNTKYGFPFCASGVPTTSGTISNGGEINMFGSPPAMYYWTINTGTNTIQIVIM